MRPVEWMNHRLEFTGFWRNRYFCSTMIADMSEIVNNILENLRNDQSFRSCVTHWERLAPREGVYASIPEEIRPELRRSFERRNITRLYSHQRRCYEEARSGRHLVVVTPTASGKTLCYNLPVVQTLLERKEARALYLFPTKALSQDQQSELNEVVMDGEIPVKVATYDGDTPASLRTAARDTGRIIITNPDMLHAGILPNHPKWIAFLTNLAYVVIDEVHQYRGVFGSHMADLIRRLKRITAFYGSNPVFICCSATIGNPRDLACRIVGEDVLLIDENGSPSGEKHVILYNPPLVDPVQGIRRGVVNESRKLAIDFLRAGVKTIVFARSRIRTELIASYINESLRNVYNDNRRIRVEAYRGGYLPRERREIEKGLRDGSIQGVVSTNALELGIDIGGLDAAILAGFPGSISSVWQQAGRAGRRAGLSLAVFVASSSPVDQFLVRHPEYFFSRSPESGWIDPDNLFILLDHLKCATFELPFREGEGFPGPVNELLDYLEENGTVRRSGGAFYWADRSYPAEGVSLRSATSDNVVIIDETGGRHQVIGEMDRISAREMLHDNAVYLHRGDQYVVRKLDLANRQCFVRESDVNYYTDALVKRDIKVLHEDRRELVAGTEAVIGDILVRSNVAKFKKIRFNSHENIGYGEISLPEEEMHTRSAVLLFREDTPAGRAFDAIPEQLKPAVTARIGHLLRQVAPVFLMCEPGDLGVAERLRDPHFAETAVYLYDSYPGGTGLSEGVMANLAAIGTAALDLVRGCPCSEGCPSCVGPVDPNEEFKGNPKEAVIDMLAAWMKEI